MNGRIYLEFQVTAAMEIVSGFLRVAIIFCVSIVSTTAQHGLYLSNATDILYKAQQSGALAAAVSVYHDASARIVALAIDTQENRIFWTDISVTLRGIYTANIDRTGQLSDVTRIVSHDLGEANGLAVDWVSRHVYWTDVTYRSVEVAEYDGSNRRVLTIDGLQFPRGIVVDPNDGYLYWNDQGTRMIERSRLDGSARENVLAESDLVQWPNHMVIIDQDLHYVDGKRHALVKVKKDGSAMPEDVNSLAGLTGDNPAFGLATDGDTFLISTWHHGELLMYRDDVASVLASDLGSQPLFGLAYNSPNLQSVSDESEEQPCRVNRGGCSHLCLPTDVTTYRCTCPSYGGVTLNKDETTCQTPTNVMFYVLTQHGIVGYLDMDSDSGSVDRYLVGRSARPVAVTYDPVEQMVYWSDVHESTVHRVSFTGAAHTIFMSSVTHSIGVVDGLALDVTNRKLYYTNMGSVSAHDQTHSWHRIELISLDDGSRKTVVSDVEKPRGLHVDTLRGHLYYTDWGSRAAVMRVNLDGSEPQALRVGLDNPNSVSVIDGQVYYVDSHYKKLDNTFSGAQPIGALYRLDPKTNEWIVTKQMKIPFGMTSIDGELYVSDWEAGLVHIDDVTESSLRLHTDDVIHQQLITAASLPSGLHYTPVSMDANDDHACYGSNCVICLSAPTGQATCTCDTYSHKTGTNTCQEPRQSMLIADHNAIKMLDITTPKFHLDPKSANTNVVVEGNPFFSNFVAMTRDGNIVYFSDVNRGAIYRMTLGGEPEVLHFTDHVVDGLAIDNDAGVLFWTAITDGKTGKGMLTAMDLRRNRMVHELLAGLSRPRAIRVDTTARYRYLYWTEWGSNPRVARATYSVDSVSGLSVGAVDTLLDDRHVIRPNGLAIHPNSGRLCVGDAGSLTFIQCHLNGSDCANVTIPSKVDVRHIFSVTYANEQQILFSDWLRGTISVLDLGSNRILDVVSSLMRPTEILLSPSETGMTCPPGLCGHGCVSYPGGFYCQCPVGQPLAVDAKTCINDAEDVSSESDESDEDWSVEADANRNSDEDNDDDDEMSLGIVIGATAAALVVMLLVIIIVMIVLRRSKKKTTRNVTSCNDGDGDDVTSKGNTNSCSNHDNPIYTTENGIEGGADAAAAEYDAIADSALTPPSVVNHEYETLDANGQKMSLYDKIKV